MRTVHISKFQVLMTILLVASGFMLIDFAVRYKHTTHVTIVDKKSIGIKTFRHPRTQFEELETKKLQRMKRSAKRHSITKLLTPQEMMKEFNDRRKYGRSSPVLNLKDPNFKLYDLDKPSNDTAQCVPFKVTPPFDICVHNVSEDTWLSRAIVEHGLWEISLVGLFLRTLRKNEDLALIDIGANLGIYSLIGASMDRDVISVEPLRSNIIHLHKSVKINGFEDKISLVENAVSNKRGRVYFKMYEDNQGGASMWEGATYCQDPKQNCPSAESIYLDDLIPLAEAKNITQAVIKMDVEGAEHLAFAKASNLLRVIEVPVIFMEISVQRKFCGRKAQPSPEKQMVDDMFNFFKKEDYTRVYSSGISVYLMELDPDDCSDEWPRDVIWVKSKYIFP